MKKTPSVLLLLSGILFSLLSYASCPNAVSFPKFADLSARQQELISAYLPNAEIAFADWSAANNGLATEFLANTQALAHLKLRMADGSLRDSLDFIVGINHIEGDRLKLQMNTALFDEWRNAGAFYQILRSNGKLETGRFHFDHGNLGGSLHAGYDIQGYTSYIRVPRIQINYRFSDHEGDVDIDAWSPWIFGFIPDPFHLTWDNSDPRCWMGEFERKFGSLLSVVLKKI